MALGRGRLRIFDPFGNERGHFYEFDELVWTRPFNSVPSGSLAWNAGAERADLLAPPFEAAIEVETSTGWVELPNMRAVTTKVTRSGDENEFLQADLMGVAWALTWATVWDAGGSETREFSTVSPGSMLTTLLDEAKARKDATGLKWANGAITWAFTGGGDSLGHAWQKNIRKIWNVSDDLLKVVQWLSDKGAVDWQMGGRELEVYASDTILARHPDVRLRLDTTADEPQVTSWEMLATSAKFSGDEGFMYSLDAPDAERAFGRIERWSQQGNVRLASTADLYLRSVIESGKSAAVEYRTSWADHDDYSPLVDYGPGDWVWLDAANDRVRVVEQGFTLGPDGFSTGFDVLGTRHKAYLERLARKTTDLSSGQVGSDSGAPSRSPGADERIPAAMSAPVVSASQVVNEAGLASSAIRISWSAATVDENGASVEPGGYEVNLDTGSGWQVFPVEGLELEASGPPEGTVRARVRALSGQNKPGDWSPVTEVQIEALVQAVTAPRNVTVKSELGTLVVYWDGTVSGGGQPPASVQYMELEAVNGARTETTRQIASAKRWALPWPRLGETWRVRARLADTLGNTSSWVSVAPRPVTVDGVGGDDIVARSVVAALGEFISLNAGTVYGEAAEFTEAIVDNLKANRQVTNELWSNLIYGKKIGADHLDANYADIDVLRVGGYTIDASQLAGTVSNAYSYGNTQIGYNGLSSGGLDVSNTSMDFGGMHVNSGGELITPRLEVGLSGPRVIIEPGTTNVQGIFLSNSGTIGDSPGMYRQGGYLNIRANTSGTRLVNTPSTSSPANVYMDGNGTVYRATSFREMKLDIQDLDIDADTYLDGVRARSFYDKRQWETYQESDGSLVAPARIPGVVLEELIEAGLEALLSFDEHGEPLGVSYDRAWLPLVGIVRKQREQLAALEERLSRIERQM